MMPKLIKFFLPLWDAQWKLQSRRAACLDLKKNIEEWTHEIGAEKMTPFPDGKLKSITNVQNTYYRENGNIDLPYARAFECCGINETQMEFAVKYIEEHGKEFLERRGYREENGIYRILCNNEERIALFCHSAFAKAWLSVLLHIPLHIMWASFQHTHTGVTVVEFTNNPNGFTAPRCFCFSDVSHLYASKLDLLHEGSVEI